MAAIRTRSAAIMVRRFSQRSTQAPAGSPTTRKAASPAALRMPTSNSVAPNSVTASTGKASWPSWAPSWLRACAVQKPAKFRSRHSDAGGALPAEVPAAGSPVCSADGWAVTAPVWQE